MEKSIEEKSIEERTASLRQAGIKPITEMNDEEFSDYREKFHDWHAANVAANCVQTGPVENTAPFDAIVAKYKERRRP